MASANASSREYLLDRGLVHNGVTSQGINPAQLIEKITRERIYESQYWRLDCFNLDAATICDKAVMITYVGGQYSNMRIAPFLVLLFKLIQLQPELNIIEEYVNQADFKYLRALGAFYIRLFFPAADVYRLLEPLIKDYRKLRFRGADGVVLIHMDEFIDSLLTEQRVCSTTLPRLPKREVLEDQDLLEMKEDLLSEEDEEDDNKDP